MIKNMPKNTNRIKNCLMLNQFEKKTLCIALWKLEKLCSTWNQK